MDFGRNLSRPLFHEGAQKTADSTRFSCFPWLIADLFVSIGCQILIQALPFAVRAKAVVVQRIFKKSLGRFQELSCRDRVQFAGLETVIDKHQWHQVIWKKENTTAHQSCRDHPREQDSEGREEPLMLEEVLLDHNPLDNFGWIGREPSLCLGELPEDTNSEMALLTVEILCRK